MTSFDDVFNEPRRGPSMQEMMELRLAHDRDVRAHYPQPRIDMQRVREMMLASFNEHPASPYNQPPTVVTLTEAQAALIRDQIRAMPPTPTPRNQERSNPMSAKAKALFAFMDNPPDGKYDAPRPTDEQLAAVLPWLTDQVVTWGQSSGYGTVVTNLLNSLSGGTSWRTPEFFNAAGYNCNGRDREGYNSDGYDYNGFNKAGYNSRGFNVDGFNVDGYNRDGYDRDGYNKQGLDYNGNTREAAVAKLVSGWSKEHLAAVAVRLAERQAKADAEAAAKAAEEWADTAADTTNTEGTGQAPVVTTEDEAAEPVPVTSVTSTEPVRILLLDEDGSRSVFDDLIAVDQLAANNEDEDDEDEDEDEVSSPIAVAVG